MNRIKKISLQMVVMVGMTLAMSSLGLAQQEAMPDHYLGDDEIAAQMATQQKDKNNDKNKAQVATSRRQTTNRKQKQQAKRNDSRQQETIIARN
jgi:hypothetical protein